MNVIQLMQHEVLSSFSGIQSWIASASIPIIWAIVIIGISFIFRNLVVSGSLTCMNFVLKSSLPKHINIFIEAVRSPLSFLIPSLGIFIAVCILPLPALINSILDYGLKIALWIFFYWLCANISNGFFNALSLEKDIAKPIIIEVVHLLKKIMLVIITSLAVITILKTLHYPINSLLGALGIGGAAFAFASKDTIANFLGSLSLIFDHPFKIGDAISVGKDKDMKIEGTVESIGLRSTHIRTFDGSLISVPNNVLVNYNINNLSNWAKRRVVQILRLTHDTSTAVLKNIARDIHKVIQSDNNTDFFTINFYEFGESSLDFQLIYYINEPDYKRYLEIKEHINFQIMEVLEREGAAFAFPSRTLYLGDEKTEKLIQRG